MKKLFLFLALFCAVAPLALATDVTISAQQITALPFNPSDVGSDQTITVNVTSGSATVTTATPLFPTSIVGKAGFQVAIGGNQYVVASVASRSSLTLTTNYSGSTGAASMTLYKFVLLRVYANRAFQPLGSTEVVQPGGPSTGQFYKEVGVSILNTGSGNVAYIPAFVLPATTDALITNQARYTFVFFRSGGSQLGIYDCGAGKTELQLPPNSPSTFAFICNYNASGGIAPASQEAYPKTYINEIHPVCTVNQVIYYAATGQKQSCLTVGSGLQISGGELSATGGGGGGTIGGSGTLNYVPYFTSSGAIGSTNLIYSTASQLFQFGYSVDVQAGGLSKLTLETDQVVFNGGVSRANSAVMQTMKATAGQTGNFQTFTTSGGSTLFAVDINGNVRPRGVNYTWPAANATGAFLNNGSGSLSWTPFNTSFFSTSGTISPKGLATAINAKLDYGCVGDDVADDTSCLANAVSAAAAAGGKYIKLDAGTYKTTAKLTVPGGVTIVGDGRERTIIHGTANDKILDLVVGTGSFLFRGPTIQDLSIQGSNSGANQIGINVDASPYFEEVKIEDVIVRDVGSHGVYFGNVFSSTFKRIYASAPVSGYPFLFNQFNMPGNTFEGLYAQDVNVTNPAGFRIRTGDIHCWGCNGINNSSSNSWWAIIGDKTGQDGATGDLPAYFSCWGCNIESSYNGILHYSSSTSYLDGRTLFAGIAGASGTYKALSYEVTAANPAESPKGNIGPLVVFANSPLSYYANSEVIHANDLPPVTIEGDVRQADGQIITSYRNTTNNRSEKIFRLDARNPVQTITTSTSYTQPGATNYEANCASPCTLTLAWPGYGASREQFIYVRNIGSGALTLAANSSGTFNGGAGPVLTTGESVLYLPHSASADYRQVGLAGAGAANRVPFYDGVQHLTSSANLTYDGTTFLLQRAGGNPYFAANDTTNGITTRFGPLAGAPDRAIAGTTSNHPFGLWSNNSEKWTVGTAGHFTPGAANSYDFGSSSVPVRSGYFGTSVNFGIGSSVTGTAVFSNSTNANTTTLRGGAPASSLTFTLPTTLPASAGCLEVNSSGQISQTGTACGSGGGGGITSLNGQTGSGQTFANDTNVTITSATNTHTLGWTGTLAKSRQNATTVYTDQVNTFGAFVQTFQGGANHLIVDPTDTSKKFQFDVSNVATATTRTVNVPNANSTTVQANTGSANNFVTAISAQGVVSLAQPSFSNLSGTATAGQLPSTAVNSVVNDTNVTGSISAQALTLGFTGTLAKARQNAATVYNDAANAWSTGAQDFGSATSLKVPTSAGAAPTANGLVAYDSTANAWKAGVNGASKTFLMTDGSGANLTALNATQLTNGTIPIARGQEVWALADLSDVSAKTGTGSTVVMNAAPIVAGGSFTALTALGIRSTGAGAFDLTIANSENLTAGRTLTVAVGDAARTLTLGGNATLNGGTHSGTNTGDQTITLTGDVTGSGTGSFAATVANQAITYAKIQNVTDARLLGRSAGSAGSAQEITVGSGLSLSGGTLTATGGGSGTVTHTAGALTANSFVFGNGTDDIKATAAATNGQLLIGSTSANPVAATLTGSSSLTVTNGAGSITLAVATGGVTNAMLANSSITIQGSAVALGGSTLATTATPQFAGLGLGTTAPATGLTTTGHAAFAQGGQSTTTIIDVADTYSTTAGGFGINTYLALNQGANNGNSQIGIQGQVESINSFNFTAAAGGMIGVKGYALKSGTGSVTLITGVDGVADLATTGTVTTAVGVRGSVNVTGAASPVSAVHVIEAAASSQTNVSSSVTDWAQIYIKNAAKTAGTRTNQYGLYIEAQSNGGTINRSLHSAGSAFFGTTVDVTGALTAASFNGLAITTSTGTITVPNGTTQTFQGTDTIVGRATTDTLTNKTISGASNTITNIGNSSLTNSSITIAGTATALGNSISLDTITGLSSTGIIKRTAANTLAVAVAGTDYLTPSGSGASLTNVVNSITGTTNQVNASASTGAVTLSLPQDIATSSAPQFARLGLGGAAGSVTSLKVVGPTINTDATNTIALNDLTFSVTKNDTNTRTFYGSLIKPTINTGASNANTTVNVLAVDTVNTSLTGSTVNLLNLADAGTNRFTVDRSGTVTAVTINASSFMSVGAVSVLTENGSTSANTRFNRVGIGTAVHASTPLTVAGPIATAVTSVSSSPTLDATYSTILCDASGAARTMTLPASSGLTGRVYILKKTDSSANVCTFDGNASETIDGSLIVRIAGQNESITIQSDGSNWQILNASLGLTGKISGLVVSWASSSTVSVSPGQAQIQSTGALLTSASTLTSSTITRTTTLSAAVSDTSTTTISITDGSWMPSSLTIKVDSEQMSCTRSSNTLTCTRGFNNSTAATHSSGATVNAQFIYYVYAYDNSGTAAIEVTATAPASAWYGTARSKTGDTSRRLIGVAPLSFDGNLANFQAEGQSELLIVRYLVDVTSVNRMLTNQSQSTNTTKSLSTVMPVGARAFEATIYNLATAGIAYFDTSEAGSAGTGLDPAGATGVYGQNPGITSTTWLPVNSSQEFRYSYRNAPSGSNFLYLDLLSFRLQR